MLSSYPLYFASNRQFLEIKSWNAHTMKYRQFIQNIPVSRTGSFFHKAGQFFYTRKVTHGSVFYRKLTPGSLFHRVRFLYDTCGRTLLYLIDRLGIGLDRVFCSALGRTVELWILHGHSVEMIEVLISNIPEWSALYNLKKNIYRTFEPYHTLDHISYPNFEPYF